jgi:8-oxo-dGTP pyrophosphatase MutT (NUDIX family)
MPSAIPAAGTIPWRIRHGELQVALIHRPRYRDWSWPKGKVDPGEDWPVTAVRETREETGLQARLGIPLPDATYTVMSRTGAPDEKRVRYWAATVTGRPARLAHEVDEVAWLPVDVAHDRLDYARDRDQLLAVTQAHQNGWLDTWPLVVVRHAKAVARSDFSGSDDQLRPLDARGRARSAALSPVLAAYGITRLVSSPSLRCVDTLAPYAAAARLRVRTKGGLSEEGYAVEPHKAARHTVRLLARGEPAAVCSHGPVLPDMMATLAARVDRSLPRHDHVVELLEQAAEDRLVKGEALVCHVVGVGANARIIAAERHLP